MGGYVGGEIGESVGGHVGAILAPVRRVQGGCGTAGLVYGGRGAAGTTAYICR